MLCYLHAVSPVKVSGSGTSKYFNMILQTLTGTTNAVCFSPEKRATLEEFQTEKSPVKISQYRTTNKYGKDVVIGKTTLITPTTLEVPFDYE